MTTFCRKTCRTIHPTSFPLFVLLIAYFVSGCTSTATSTQGQFNPSAELYESMHYRFQIINHAEEGEVVSDKVELILYDKQTKEKTNIWGQTLHAHNPTDRTPTQFLGYTFKQANTSLEILQATDTLNMIDPSGQIIFSEPYRIISY